MLVDRATGERRERAFIMLSAEEIELLPSQLDRDLVALTAPEFHTKYFVDEALLVIRLSGAAPPATGRSSQQI